jgi:hypothetical protein
MEYMTAVPVELLRAMDRRQAAIEQHLAAIRQDLAALRAGDATGADAALVGAVFAVAGERWFLSRELIDMAARPGVPERVLQALLGPKPSPGGVGKKLGAAAGKPCQNGLVLTFEYGTDPKIWRVSTPRIPANR